MVMLSHFGEEIALPDESVVDFSGEDLAEEHIDLHSAQFLTEFRLEAGLPVWRFDIRGCIIEKRLCRICKIRFTSRTAIFATAELMRLRLRPLMHFREHEAPVSLPMHAAYKVQASGDRWKPVLDVIQKQLLTHGLRSLAPGHPDYKPQYYGDLRSRDAAYHQGTVWAWLIGPFIDAWLKVYPDDFGQAQKFLAGFQAHLGEACIGSISEVFDAEQPFIPRGCVAQAWSVAEVLRCWAKTTQRDDWGSPKDKSRRSSEGVQ